MQDQNAAAAIEALRKSIEALQLRVRRLEDELSALRRQTPDNR